MVASNDPERAALGRPFRRVGAAARHPAEGDDECEGAESREAEEEQAPALAPEEETAHRRADDDAEVRGDADRRERLLLASGLDEVGHERLARADRDTGGRRDGDEQDEAGENSVCEDERDHERGLERETDDHERLAADAVREVPAEVAEDRTRDRSSRAAQRRACPFEASSSSIAQIAMYVQRDAKASVSANEKASSPRIAGSTSSPQMSRKSRARARRGSGAGVSRARGVSVGERYASGMRASRAAPSVSRTGSSSIRSRMS